MKKIIPVLLIMSVGCVSSVKDAQEIVDSAIAAAGGDKFEDTQIEFAFRGKEYGYKKLSDGQYEYVRLFDDSVGLIRDELTNQGFLRQIDGTLTDVADSMAQKYSSSLNSVIYFALLPYGLNEPAVNKEYIGTKEVKGVSYHKIKVTFNEPQGGEDFNDVFVYWLSADTYNVDYLAYSYETEGGGVRFREAINPRYVEGIKFVDYINYKASADADLQNLDQAFESGQLEELSRIELEQVTVIPI